MRVLLTVSALAAVLAAAPIAATAAAPHVRLFAPVMLHGASGERHASWRSGDGDHDFGRHRHRQDFIAAAVPIVGEVTELGPESAPSPFVVSAPLFVNVTFAPAAGPRFDSTDGPRIIEIGRRTPAQGSLPLVIYGD